VAEVTYTSTITDAPDGMVTIYEAEDGSQFTYGASTIYEVYIYTTTQDIDLLGWACDGRNKMKRNIRSPRTVANHAYPAYVEATPTPAA
jgi:hypothetical protein